MRTGQRSLSLLIGAALVVALGCNKDNGGQTGDEGAPTGDDLFEKLSGGGYANYQPARSLSELTQASDVIAVARALRVERGRAFTSTSAGNPIAGPQTVVLHMSVLDVLKGEPGETLYLEFYVGDAEALLPSKLPDARVLVFAKAAPTEPVITGGGIEHAGRGLPAGATLRRLTTVQGFAVETSNGVRQIFEPMDTLLAADDFDTLVEQVRALLDGMIAMPGDDAGSDAAIEPRADAAIDAGPLENDASTGDASVEQSIVFSEPLFFDLPIDSIAYGVSGYDAQTDLCISVIWRISAVTETQFCGSSSEPVPAVVIEPGAAAGCWDYQATATLDAQRGCVDFAELASTTDDSVDLEVDLSSDPFTGTVRFLKP